MLKKENKNSFSSVDTCACEQTSCKKETISNDKADVYSKILYDHIRLRKTLQEELEYYRNIEPTDDGYFDLD